MAKLPGRRILPKLKMIPIGPKHITMLKSYAPGLATWGASAGVFVLILTNQWKGRDLLQYLPIYNRQYGEEKERDL